LWELHSIPEQTREKQVFLLFFEHLQCNIWFTKTHNMSRFELRLLRSDLQSRLGAILQQALRKTMEVDFPLPLCIRYHS